MYSGRKNSYTNGRYNPDRPEPVKVKGSTDIVSIMFWIVLGSAVTSICLYAYSFTI
jgi:hypothetical protein